MNIGVEVDTFKTSNNKYQITVLDWQADYLNRSSLKIRFYRLNIFFRLYSKTTANDSSRV